MRTQLLFLGSTLRSAYWFIPTLMACGAVALAIGSVKLDEFVHGAVEAKLGWIYAGGPAGARAVLATIAGSIITVAGTTFSITIAAFSLASSQFGPRLLRTFRRDTGNQIVLGTFISTFVYSLLVLRTIRGTESDTYVPHLSVTLGVTLACLSLAVLIYFIHHTAASIQVSNLIDSVGTELEKIIVKHFPQRGSCAAPKSDISWSPQENSVPILARKGGYLLHIDYQALVEIAVSHNIVFRLFGHAGDFTVAGTPLVAIEGDSQHIVDWREIESHIYFGTERTPEQDLEFGFLQLAEIAVRALSPGINDPFTAISCIDRISAGFCLFVQREIPSAFHYDATGALRLIAVPVTYRQLVQAAFHHIGHAGKQNPWVLQHLRGKIMLVLSMTVNEGCREALMEELILIQQAERALEST